MTLKQRIIDILICNNGLTNREITNIIFDDYHPQQAVNQACNKLKREGKITRQIGDSGRIQNYIDKNFEMQQTEVELECARLIVKSSKKTVPCDNNYNLDESELVKLDIDFISFHQTNLISKLMNKTLEETINSSKYNKFKVRVRNKYEEYLSLPIGEFLLMLKHKNDMFYLDFLNRNGDKTYCKFRLKSSRISKKKGIYFYKLSGEIVYIGRCRDSFSNRFNNGYGSISAKNCYIDGQSTNCHINSKVNDVHEELEIFALC